MDKEEDTIFNIIKNYPTAILATDLDLNVLVWSKGAQELFGYSREEVIGKPIQTIPSYLPPEFRTVFGRILRGELINLKTKRLHKDGHLLDVVINLSPVFDEDDKVIGLNAIMRRLSEMELIEKKVVFEKHMSGIHTKKRTFKTIRNSIIGNLSSGKKTINQLAVLSGINWKTVENHLVHLSGKRLVKEVFNSEYVRIFDITKEGQEYLARMKSTIEAQK